MTRPPIEHEEGYYGLVVPFVVCASQGGPWDDQAFVQGVHLGVLIQRMEYGEDDAMAYVHPELVRQIDLAAMHFGYSMSSEPWDEHNTLVTLVRGRDDDAESLYEVVSGYDSRIIRRNLDEREADQLVGYLNRETKFGARKKRQNGQGAVKGDGDE